MDWKDHKHQKICFSQVLCAALLLQEYGKELPLAAWDVLDDWQLLNDWLKLADVLEGLEGAGIAKKLPFFSFLKVLPIKVQRKYQNLNQTKTATG